MVPFHLQVLNKFYLLLNCSEKLDGNQSCHPDQHFSSILLPLIFSSPLYPDRKDPFQSSSRFSHDKSKLKHWIIKLSVSISLHQNNNIAIICFQNQWKWDSQSVSHSVMSIFASHSFFILSFFSVLSLLWGNTCLSRLQAVSFFLKNPCGRMQNNQACKHCCGHDVW